MILLRRLTGLPLFEELKFLILTVCGHAGGPKPQHDSDGYSLCINIPNQKQPLIEMTSAVPLAAEVELMRSSGWDLPIIYVGLIAFFVGGAIAASLALLCVAAEDRQTRGRVRSFAGQAWRRTSDAVNELTQQGRELVSQTAAPFGAACVAGREAFWREYNRNRE